MTTFVLIPGAGGQAWYWHRVVPRLRFRGHDAVAVDLPSGDEEARLDDYVRTVVQAVPPGAARDAGRPGPRGGRASHSVVWWRRSSPSGAPQTCSCSWRRWSRGPGRPVASGGRRPTRVRPSSASPSSRGATPTRSTTTPSTSTTCRRACGPRRSVDPSSRPTDRCCDPWPLDRVAGRADPGGGRPRGPALPASTSRPRWRAQRVGVEPDVIDTGHLVGARRPGRPRRPARPLRPRGHRRLTGTRGCLRGAGGRCQTHAMELPQHWVTADGFSPHLGAGGRHAHRVGVVDGVRGGCRTRRRAAARRGARAGRPRGRAAGRPRLLPAGAAARAGARGGRRGVRGTARRRDPQPDGVRGALHRPALHRRRRRARARGRHEPRGGRRRRPAPRRASGRRSGRPGHAPGGRGWRGRVPAPAAVGGPGTHADDAERLAGQEAADAVAPGLPCPCLTAAGRDERRREPGL